MQMHQPANNPEKERGQRIKFAINTHTLRESHLIIICPAMPEEPRVSLLHLHCCRCCRCCTKYYYFLQHHAAARKGIEPKSRRTSCVFFSGRARAPHDHPPPPPHHQPASQPASNCAAHPLQAARRLRHRPMTMINLFVAKYCHPREIQTKKQESPLII